MASDFWFEIIVVSARRLSYYEYVLNILSIYVRIENTSDRIRLEFKGVREPNKFKKALKVWADTRHLLFIILLRDEVYKTIEITYNEHL